MRRALGLIITVLLASATPATAAAATAAAAGDPPPPPYRPPVVAPVIDPFRPPTTPYGPGNRGLEYATVPGTAVRAAADGVVSFAGRVAADLHVTIAHPDGIRTSYSFLSSVAVRRGARVGQGQVLGRARSRLHVGARRGDTYLDPASLWVRRGPPHLRLVPLDGGPRDGARRSFRNVF